MCIRDRTTNGILLEQQLDGLVKAGLDGVNISLDTLNQMCIRDRSTHVQVEVAVKGNGGPNAHPLKRVAMRCG